MDHLQRFRGASQNIPSKPSEDASRQGLPPRPQHQRSSSGGGTDSSPRKVAVHPRFTPPLFARKTATSPAQDQQQDFHRRNQEFLHYVQTKSHRRLNSSGSSGGGSLRYSGSPRRGKLEAIGDIEEDDGSDFSEPSPAPSRVEVKGMHLLREADVHHATSTSASCKDWSTMSGGSSDSQSQMQTEHQRGIVIGASENSSENEYIGDYVKELELERDALIKHWKAEFLAELRASDCISAPSPPANIVQTPHFKVLFKPFREVVIDILETLELFICNMPLSIAASALSWVTMGVVWFKFIAEHLVIAGSCKPVHFHSVENTYSREFPGGFSCDQGSVYKSALYFHFTCTFVAAILAFFFLSKLVLAWRVVSDDLLNPVTATPVGVICITLEVLFAVSGNLGMCLVFAVSFFHAIFAFWYLYVAAFKFNLLPDPSWFPGTVGLAYAAVKCWIYSNILGKAFLGLCLAFFFGTFFISIIRVALNKKIAAPVCWIQLSAPSIALYAATIISQPSAKEEIEIQNSSASNESYHEQMHDHYLQFQHFMMSLSILGMVSALHSLWARWDKFREKEFSPAHLAFCFPTLSHTNAVQAYRAAINAFSSIPKNSHFHTVLYAYWVACLVMGTIVNIAFTYKAFVRLPLWTNIKTAGEEEPPKPADTIMAEMISDTHEVLFQPFVSPAVLQANESGVLVRIRRGTEDFRTHGPYVRTRHVTALGFDPLMSEDELRQERARLLDWVARNAPRRRQRTLSVPLMFYGTFSPESGVGGHRRSQTSSLMES